MRHVLITGGSRGIGLSIAQAFAEKSYRCTLISRSKDNLETALTTLTPTASTTPHHYISGSITSPDFWTTSNFASKGLTKGADASKIDVLVNCAGITQSRLFTTTPAEDIQAIVDTNLTSLMLGTRFLLRNRYLHSTTKTRGEDREVTPSIINVSSLLGMSGGYGAVAYAASKAGVLGFTRALATEYVGHGVRVNAIVPGYVESDMTKGVFPFSLYATLSHAQTCSVKKRRVLTKADLNIPQLKERIPLKRFGKPEEIAHAALFLAENQYAHNCVLNLDGGLSAV
jgi:NAD(P)-dependent dehydrogenase (short-subunit alcohol dehydrogenase family)